MTLNLYGEKIIVNCGGYGASVDEPREERNRCRRDTCAYRFDGREFATDYDAVNYLMDDGMTYDQAMHFLSRNGGMF